MATCPKGHTSTATDYCDECGTPMNPPPQSTVDAAPAPAGESGGEPCPECGAPRDGRFCEVCGHDFLATPDAAAAPAPLPVTSSTVEENPPATPAATGWRIVVSADRAYYERMRDAGDPDAEAVAFPVFCPERRFVLSGAQVLVGRRSRSRGIEPDVDLTGPPEDAGVSHTHALFVAGPDGGWSIVDLDSANGTYLNDSTEQLAANQPVPLHRGDRVHVGAWTTLTVLAD